MKHYRLIQSTQFSSRKFLFLGHTYSRENKTEFYSPFHQGVPRWTQSLWRIYNVNQKHVFWPIFVNLKSDVCSLYSSSDKKTRSYDPGNGPIGKLIKFATEYRVHIFSELIFLSLKFIMKHKVWRKIWSKKLSNLCAPCILQQIS